MLDKSYIHGGVNWREFELTQFLILCELDGGLRRHGVLGEEVQVQREPGLLVMTRGKASVGNTESEWNAREGLPLLFIHSFVA